MHKNNYKIRKSFNKNIQKENNAEGINHHHTHSLYPSTKNINHSIPSITTRVNTKLNPLQNNNTKINNIQKKTINLEPVKNELRTSYNQISGSIKFVSQKQLTQISYEINELQNLNLITNYSKELLTDLLQKKIENGQFLKNHDINVNLRARMLDWMIQVLMTFKCSEISYFRAINIMDRYFSKVEQKKQPSELHLIGVVSMYMACKLEEIYPIKMKTIFEKITHKKIGIQTIKNNEGQYLELFGFVLNVPTLYDFIQILLRSAKLVKICKKQFEEIQKIAIYIAKLTMYEYTTISKYNLQIIATAIIIISFKIFMQLQCGIFSLQENCQRIYDLIQNDNKEEVKECSYKIHTFFKNFDKIYPNLLNFKKYFKLSTSIDEKVGGDRYCTL